MTDRCYLESGKCRIKTLFGSREDIESTSHIALHDIWDWAKKIKTDTLMRLRKNKFEIYFPDLFNELNECNKIVEQYLNINRNKNL